MKTRSRIFSTIIVLWCVFEMVFAESRVTSTPEEKQVFANAATEEECREYTPDVFLTMLLTLIVVFAAELLVFIFWKYYWKLKHGTHLVLVTDVEKGEPEFAFDNPGFREGTPVFRAKKPVIAEEKVSHNENVQQMSNGHKPQSLDECLNKSDSDMKTNVVPLRSRDFTGLGFNICGNMRDGIYVKDVLHHGPASETGKIKAGDRISAIRINFSHMVYEDAMAILSYASPYDVELEVEDSSLSLDSLKNTSLNNHIRNLFYRSQSFSAAQHIQKVIPRKLNFNGTATQVQTQSTDANKISVLAVSQESQVPDKVSKFGGIKVLPDIQVQSTIANSLPLESAEKQQNATTIDFESDSGIETKTLTSFDEVDLSSPSTQQPGDKTSSLTSTFKDHNVKKALVKGIQNLKEKLNSHIQKSNDKKETPREQINDDLEQVSSEKLENCVRVRSASESSGTDEVSQKNSKRKAPLPPPPVVQAVKMTSEFNLLNEIENEVNKHNYENMDDSEVEDESRSNTIQLNSSHITVHHVPEETNRKTASLGDLSTIVGNDLSSVPLERAVSLGLADHTPRSSSNKRKAPMPPEEMTEDAPFKEAKLDTTSGSKLKKSSMFGTLEEAVKHPSSTDQDLNGDMLLTSTPMKLSDEPFPVVDSMSNISWELNFDLQDADKDDVFLVDEKAPDLPTSPIPNLPTYVTEIKVSNGHENDLSNVNTSDLTLFTTAVEVSTDLEDSTNETRYVQNGSQESNSPTSADNLEKTSNATESEESSINTMKEVTCNGTIQENHKTEVVRTKSKIVPTSVKVTRENGMKDHTTTINLCTPRYRTNNTDSSSNKKKLPISSTKLPKLSQSVSPVRAVGSRIPVRANTEPSLKVSLINRDELAKNKKCKLSDDSIENGKLTFSTSNSHLPSAVHKTSVLAEIRPNGPNR